MKKFIPIILIAIASFFILQPLLHSGFFPIHDSTQTARIHQMGKSLSEGQFPVRWVRDLGYGYGYPIFNFYAPLPYYVGAFINLIGFSYLASTKIVMALAIVFSGFSMYWLGLGIFKSRWTAVCASVFYMYAPYQALDLYVRGAVGEMWAMGFIPIVVLSTTKLLIINKVQSSKFKDQSFKYILIGSFALAAIILSHTIAGMLTAFYLGVCIGIVGIYSLLKKKTLSTLYVLLSTFLLALGLSAFFWLPAVAELRYTSVSKLTTGGSNFRDHFVYLDQLWAAPWGFAGSTAGRADGMSFMVGKLHVLFAAVAVLCISLYRPLRSRYGALVVSSLVLCLFFLYMTTPASLPVWESLKYFSFVQFPWRHLMFVICFISILAALSIERVPKQWFFSLVLCGIVIGYNGKYFKPQYSMDTKDADFTSKKVMNWNTSQILDEYMPLGFVRPKSEDQLPRSLLKGSSEAMNQQSTTTSFSFTYTGDNPQTLVINRAYYPSWMVTVDNQRTQSLESQGLLSISVPQGTHSVKGILQKTLFARVGEMISVLTVVGIISGAIYAKQKASN